MKNFIDHLAYFYHRPCFFDKKGLVVVTTAGTGHKKVSNYLSETLYNWGFNKVYKIAMPVHQQNLKEKDIEKINKTSMKWYNDLKSGKLHNPSFKAILYYNLWKRMSTSSNPIELDNRYWTFTRLKDYYFAPNVPLNPLKKVFGILISGLFGKIFK
jgi:multimeric flavodoxin WrbA